MRPHPNMWNIHAAPACATGAFVVECAGACDPAAKKNQMRGSYMQTSFRIFLYFPILPRVARASVSASTWIHATALQFYHGVSPVVHTSRLPYCKHDVKGFKFGFKLAGFRALGRCRMSSF